MNSKHLKDLAVISIADGEKLGTVSHTYVDTAAKKITGFAFTAPSGVFAPESAPRVDAAHVHSIGPDALTLDDKSAVQGGPLDEGGAQLVELSALAKQKVVTEGGVLVGQVASVEFDGQAFHLTQFEVSPGFFKGNKMVPIAHVTSIGPDLIVVADAVLAEPEPKTDGGEDAAAATETRFVVGDIEPAPRT